MCYAVCIETRNKKNRNSSDCQFRFLSHPSSEPFPYGTHGTAHRVPVRVCVCAWLCAVNIRFHAGALNPYAQARAQVRINIMSIACLTTAEHV